MLRHAFGLMLVFATLITLVYRIQIGFRFAEGRPGIRNLGDGGSPSFP
jgi:hypothetical protein